jgi:protein disulfide-isomerase
MITGRKEISRNLSAEVRKAVLNADRVSKSNFERQTVIPTAAYVLQEIGDSGSARDLLTREIKRSPTPWYIYSSLSSLEEKLGNKTAALKYAAQASQTVAGKSSRVQWISGELNLALRIGGEQAKAAELIKKLYDSVFSVSDGFSGRNWARLSSVEKKLKLSALDPELRPSIIKFQGRCSEMVGDQKSRCETHFQNLLAR